MTHSPSGIACTFALLWVLGCALPAQALAGDIIVSRDAGLDASQRADVRADAGVTHERMLALPDAEVVSVPDDRESRALAALNADPDVRYAVPDVRVHAADTGPDDPNDYWYFTQWALEQANDADIDILKAWEAAPDGTLATVAVVDQQINVNHPDLKRNIEPGGRDFTQPDGCTAPTPTAAADHGTHVAGIIAAERDNEIGIAGIAPLAHILPLRTLDNCGGGSLSWVIDAFIYAGEQGIPIVTGSFGTDPLLDGARKAEINKAFADVFALYQNTLYVVASGNEGNDNGENAVYPCDTLDGPRTEPVNLVCVGMTDQNDAPVCSGNVGGSVDVYAPGVNIVSTVGPNGYWPLSGTSTATPMVAAVAALFWSQPGTSHAAFDVKEAVTASASVDRLGFAPPEVGRLNAARAVGVRSGLGSGGPGREDAWVSCDGDHDGFAKTSDQCPDKPGTLHGCPDADRDGLRDTEDNCPNRANPDQTDADGDGIGDLCDDWPRGDDVDGDARAALDDRCPYVAGFTADGCPPINTPPIGNDGSTLVPPPVMPPPANPTTVTRILDLDVQVTPPKCPKGHPKCTKAAKVTVKLSRRATVALKLEMRIKRKGRWVWTRVTSKSVTATASGRSLTIRGKSGRSLAKGPYRVTASLSASKTALNFRV